MNQFSMTRCALTVVTLVCVCFLPSCGTKSDAAMSASGGSAGSQSTDEAGAGPSNSGAAGEATASGGEPAGGEPAGGEPGTAGSGTVGSAGAGAIVPSGTAVGTVAGESLDGQGSISLFAIDKGNVAGAVTIANITNLCELAIASTKNHTDFAGGRALHLQFQGIGSTKYQLGTYTITVDPKSGLAAFAQLSINDQQCGAEHYDAVSGSLELTRFDDAGIVGTYSLTFAGGDELSGTFDAPACNAILTTVRDPSAPAKEVCIAIP